MQQLPALGRCYPGSPDHLRHINAHIWTIQYHFTTLGTVIQQYPARSVKTNEKLLTLLVRVLSPQLRRWDIEYDEITLWKKWHFGWDFADCE